MDNDQADPRGSLHRPSEDWRCTDDGAQWPCPVYKRRMWTWYRQDRLRLAMIMSGFRDNAVVGGMSREVADARFLGWIGGPPVRQVKRSI
ncbi:hypothetical protein AB0J90_10320 [Micromonospora sp. NPDC049523]|uniref:hypothetical protein n=1 Tax=Micromonospora sp. NPDC049523 TaxID=3155921 RepID=UPI0034476D62